MTHSAFLVLAASRRLRPEKVGLGVKEADNDEGFITHADGSVSKKPSSASQEADAEEVGGEGAPVRGEGTVTATETEQGK